jgi:hypothetical protein
MLIVPNDLILLNANYSILVVDQAIRNNMVQSFNAHRPHPINLVAIEDSVSPLHMERGWGEVTEKQNSVHSREVLLHRAKRTSNNHSKKLVMRKIPIAVLTILNIVYSFGQKAGHTISVIPIPVSVQIEKGNFALAKTASIELKTNDADAKQVAGFLSKKLSAPTDLPCPSD